MAFSWTRSEALNHRRLYQWSVRLLLLTQIIARVSVDNRTRALVRALHRVTEVKLLTGRVEELSCHLLEFPETRGVAIKVSVLCAEF